jgi:hypothetical protein
MPKLHLKNKAKGHKNVCNLVDMALSEVRSIPQYSSLRLNPELTKSLCVFIEDVVSSFSKTQADKIDKTNVAVEVLTKAFGLSPAEVENIKSQVEFLVENKLISKSSILTQLSDVFCSKSVPASNSTSSVTGSLVSND